MNPSLGTRLRTLLTPLRVLAGVILVVGAAVVVYRFIFGLASTTNLSNLTAWGLWTGFKLVFVALAASGYTLTTGVYLFGMHEYHPLVRPAVLSGFLGYSLFILILIFDLGRPWRIYYPFLVQPGFTSALFEIALCVGLYYTTQFLELTPVGFEWLGWKKWRQVMVGVTAALTVFGLLLSFLHQSSLGALFLTVPGKVHPLWYSSYIPLHFFISSAFGGLSMVIMIGLLCNRVFGHRFEISRAKLDELTIGLAKAASITMMVYFGVKVADLALDNKWHYLPSAMGAWYLVEMIGFVLLPAIVYAVGHRERRPRLIRFTAVWTILGIVLNRLNISVIAFNYELPSVNRYTPHPLEYVVVLFLITFGIVVFRLVAEWFPIVHEHEKFKTAHEGVCRGD